jgi:hypothetical protein
VREAAQLRGEHTPCHTRGRTPGHLGGGGQMCRAYDRCPRGHKCAGLTRGAGGGAGSLRTQNLIPKFTQLSATWKRGIPPGGLLRVLGFIHSLLVQEKGKGPGLHARLWVSRCRLFKHRSSNAGPARSIFQAFPHGKLDDPSCAGSGERTPGCRRLPWASGQPGAACAPLGKQMPALGVCSLKRESALLGTAPQRRV